MAIENSQLNARLPSRPICAVCWMAVGPLPPSPSPIHVATIDYTRAGAYRIHCRNGNGFWNEIHRRWRRTLTQRSGQHHAQGRPEMNRGWPPAATSRYWKKVAFGG
ncbi:unnamed protein product [Somion occarium]|uniref:Uncharacterized protein n=1 Tax=Somion occarium TaxID=3059160 RepID=A0ABP1DLI5_9APHY